MSVHACMCVHVCVRVMQGLPGLCADLALPLSYHLDEMILVYFKQKSHITGLSTGLANLSTADM